MLRLTWLEELVPVVVLLVELLFLVKRDFRRLVLVLLLELLLVSAEATVVRASAALAVWGCVAMKSAAERSNAAMRNGLTVLEDERRDFMVCLWLCGPCLERALRWWWWM